MLDGMDTQTWDAVVVGGGAAGLSGALMLGRARRRVLVIDSGQPRNRFTSKMHGVLGRDGTSPADLLADGRREIESYGGVIRQGVVTDAQPFPGGFTITYTGQGSQPTAADDAAVTVRARRILVATGLHDGLPYIDGLAQWWGRGVAMCPYCDGYEVRDRRIGILATGPGSTVQAQLLRQWSPSIIYLPDTVGMPQESDLGDFAARGIEIQEGGVRRVLDDTQRLTGVELEDGTRVQLDAIFTAPALTPADEVLRMLGAQTADGPVGSFVVVDATGRTNIEGVWAAGNVVDPMANVPVSIGAGAQAAGAINHDLVLDDIAQARSTGEA